MASVLEGFLVRLGFEVDKDGQKRFDANVEAASERVKSMATRAVAAGAAIGAAFLKASGDVNELYNSTNFTGTSIKGFTALQKAVERVGGSGASVSAAFQNLAQNVMTLGPGFEELLDQQLGVSLTDSTGKLRDMSDVFMDIRNKLAEINKVDPIQARQIASVVGLGDAFDAVMKKDFPAELERTRSLMGGFAEDVDKSADSTHRFMNELSNTWGILTSAIQSGAAQITDALDLDQKLKDFNDGFSGWLQDTVSAEVQMVKDSDGVLDWAKKWLFEAGDYQEAAKQKRLGKASEKHSAETIPERPVATVVVDDDGQEVVAGDIKQSRFATVRGIRNNNPGNLRASRLASGKSDGFSTFATMADGYQAMAEQLKMYGNAGLENVASIVTKYAPASENNTSAYIDSVVSSMRKDLGTKELGATTRLDLGDPRVLKALVDAMIDHENGSGASDYFNGSAYSAAIAAASQTTRKSRAVTDGDKIASTGGIVINQSITVSGQDAVAAAGTISRETKRQIARNSTSNLS